MSDLIKCLKNNIEDVILIFVYAVTIIYFNFMATKLEDAFLQATRDVLITISTIGAFGAQLLLKSTNIKQPPALVSYYIEKPNIINGRKQLCLRVILVVAFSLLSPLLRYICGVTDSSLWWNGIFNFLGACLVCFLLFYLLPRLSIKKIVNNSECVSAEWIVLSISGVLATEYQCKENKYTEVPSVASIVNALGITFAFLVLFMSISCVVTQIVSDKKIDAKLKKPLIFAFGTMAIFCSVYVSFNSHFPSFLYVLFLCALIAIWFIIIVALLYWNNGKYVLLLSPLFCVGFPILIYFGMRRAVLYWDSLSTYLLISFSMCVSFFPLYFIRKNR